MSVSPKLNNTLYYDFETLGRTVELASVDVIETSRADIESHWYRGAGPVDLFFWTRDEKLIKHQINFYGQVIEWNRYDGLKTGYINYEGESRKANGAREIIDFDLKPNETILHKAIEFLDCISSIENQIIERMKEDYRTHFFWKNIPFRSFFRKWIALILKK